MSKYYAMCIINNNLDVEIPLISESYDSVFSTCVGLFNEWIEVGNKDNQYKNLQHFYPLGGWVVQDSEGYFLYRLLIKEITIEE